jgi:hypothetical protein
VNLVLSRHLEENDGKGSTFLRVFLHCSRYSLRRSSCLGVLCTLSSCCAFDVLDVPPFILLEQRVQGKVGASTSTFLDTATYHRRRRVHHRRRRVQTITVKRWRGNRQAIVSSWTRTWSACKSRNGKKVAAVRRRRRRETQGERCWRCKEQGEEDAMLGASREAKGLQGRNVSWRKCCAKEGVLLDAWQYRSA